MKNMRDLTTSLEKQTILIIIQEASAQSMPVKVVSLGSEGHYLTPLWDELTS